LTEDGWNSRGLRKLDKEELHNLYTSPDVIRMMKDEMVSSFSTHWAKRDECRILVGKQKGRRTLGSSRHRIIL
jgi:hypothetical protein